MGGGRMNGIRPVARRDGLLSTEMDGEIIVYDRHRDVACSLNATAATVWRMADGTRTVPELADALRAQVNGLADEDLVMVTLDRLEEQGLIESGYERRDEETTRLDRRRFIRRAGVVGAGALALPVVQSIVAPTPAAAISGQPPSCGHCCELGPGPSPQPAF